MTTISIIVPVYNVEKYIGRCLESILSQTFDDFELILVNDGSEDNCGKICDQYAQKDSRIKVIHQANKGLSAARNIGIAIAKGRFLAFVDSDDWIEHDMYEILLRNITQYDADIAVCGRRLVYESSENELLDNSSHKDFLFNQEDVFKRLFSLNDHIDVVAWNKLYKRELFEEIRYPEGRIYEDIFIISELLLKCDKIHVTTKPLYNYLQRKDSIRSKAFSIDKLDNIIASKKNYDIILKHYPQYIENIRAYLCKKYFLVLKDILVSNYNNRDLQDKIRLEIKKELPFIIRSKEFTCKRKISAICLMFSYRLFLLCINANKYFLRYS